MTRIPQPLKVAARLVVLLATLGLLVATTAPRCGEHTAPVVFRAHGTCGPDGLVVITADSSSGSISFGNVAVLGLPPDARGQFPGWACPIVVEQGGWQVTIPSWACTDAGATTPCQRSCTVATVTSGPLQFACVDAQGAALCASTLTVEE